MIKRQSQSTTQERGRVRRLVSRMTTTVGRMFHRRSRDEEWTPSEPEQPASSIQAESAPRARAVKRESDVPLDTIAQLYTPSQSGMKTGFRSDGRDRQSDSELAIGSVRDDFNEEDAFTNKTNDPRIGTHRRNHDERDQRRTS